MSPLAAEGGPDPLRGGKDADFERRLEPLLEPAYRLAFAMLRDRQAAEDAVQESALRAWRRIATLRGGPGGLRPWFLTIVANQCRSTRRRRWWSELRSAVVDRGSVPGPDPATTDLRVWLAALPYDQRLVLALHFYLDLPLDEVARILGVSEPAAKARVYRATRTLRPRLAIDEDRR